VNGTPRLFAPGAFLRWALRLVVAGALLFLVIRMALPQNEAGAAATIIAAWRTGPIPAASWFALSCGLFGVSFAVGASRFSMLLAGAGMSLGWWALFRAYLVASFFNLALPGAILGDVYRVWDVRREAGEGSRALGIVAVERLLGFSALGCLGLVAAPFIPFAPEDRYFAAVLIGICALIAVVAALALHPRANRGLRNLGAPIARISARAAGTFDNALRAVADLAESPRVLARAFGLSLVNQGLPVAAVYCLAIPLVSSTAWYWFAIIVPFVTLVSLVPISIGGTGVREYLYVTLFGAVGMPSEVALALSLSLLGTAILWALVGFAIFSFDRRHDRAPVENPAA
jgi:uncharacterized membrane protein YbhN (UPF0104 family)